MVLALIHDPLARALPDEGRIVIGDGRLQVEVNLADARVREDLGHRSAGRVLDLLAWQAETGAAVLPISAGEDTVEQMRRRMRKRIEPIDHFIFYRGAGNTGTFGLTAVQQNDENTFLISNRSREAIPKIFALIVHAMVAAVETTRQVLVFRGRQGN